MYNFYPALFFIALQSLLLGLLKRQVGEEVAHQGFPGFETAQIVLGTRNHELQTRHWVPQSPYKDCTNSAACSSTLGRCR